MSIKVMSWVWEHGPASASERLVLLALADFCDDQGVCFPSMVRIAAKACITERGAQKILRRMEEEGLVSIETGGGRHGCNRYTINMRNHEPETVNMVHPERRSGERGDTKPRTREQKPRTRVQETLNGGSPEPSLTTIEPSEEPSPREREFDAFWHVYPRKVGKDAARKAWLSARRRAGVETIVSGLRAFVEATRGSDPQFIAHPATWLNQGRWQDDQSHARNGPRSSTEDLRGLATISAADDVARLWGGPPSERKAIGH